MKPKLDENTQTTSKPTEVVLEDIRLHDCILKSKVSKKKEKRRLKRNNLLASNFILTDQNLVYHRLESQIYKHDHMHKYEV